MKFLIVLGVIVLSLALSAALWGVIIMACLGAAHAADPSIPAYGYDVCFWFGVIAAALSSGINTSTK